MDIYFGTFKASFSENIADKDGPKAREDEKSSLRILPNRDFVIYLSLSSACVAAWAIPASTSYPVSETHAMQLGSLVGFGPVVLATLMLKSGGVKPAQMNILANLMHLSVGSIFCSLPVAYMCYLALTKLAV
jgi:hypothetical protein